MAQPSVVNYFSTRKRSAVDEHKIGRAKKVLLLEKDNVKQVKDHVNLNLQKVSDSPVNTTKVKESLPESKISELPKEGTPKNESVQRKVVRAQRGKKIKEDTPSRQDIQHLLARISNKIDTPSTPKSEPVPGPSSREDSNSKPVTPTNTVKPKQDLNLKEIKNKINRSSRLNQLRESINRFSEGSRKLKEAEEKTAKLLKTPTKEASPLKLKEFKSIEFEVLLSPQKHQTTPEKPYLSPKKDCTARRNLLNCLSPTKNAVPALAESPSKQILENTSQPALKLPYKFRALAEFFGAIDVVTQIMINRKETVTFKKVKPAVEKLLKRNLTEKHLAQIKSVYPEAYKFTQEKLRVFGVGMRKEEWELVITPIFGDDDRMNEQVVLHRKRALFKILLDKVKDYHDEFLKNLTPPMDIPKDKITRWHPEFDIEKIPDIDCADIPQPPVEEKLTGKEVLERARQMYNCNTRMDQALARLQAAKEANPELQEVKSTQPESVLKGIPKALLEKVRQKQAAKALASMTRSVDKEKEVRLYSRLPEIARLTRNVFVTEKKGVMPLEVVMEKLSNCYRTSLTKPEMENHLRTIAKEVPGWLTFDKIRSCDLIKVAKEADLSLVISKLESLAKEKSEN